MKENRSERIKLYMLLGVFVIFIVTGYFRFIHKKAATGVPVRPTPTLTLTPVRTIPAEIPQIKSKTLLKLPEGKAPGKEPLRTSIRDIFSSLKSPAMAQIQSTDTESSKAENKQMETLPPTPPKPLKLGGMIVGSGQPIAIINDQIVREGDWVGEYRVVKIGKKEVLLKSGNDQKVLEVFGPIGK